MDILSKKLIRLSLCFTIIILLVDHLSAHAQTNGTIELVSHYGGDSNAIFVSGDIAYIGTGRLLSAFDISNPESPVLLGKSPILSNIIKDIDVVGTTAYVSVGYGMDIVDVTLPTDMSLLSSFDTPNNALNINVANNVAYITNMHDGLLLVDVADPSNPTQLSSYQNNSYVWDVQISGNFAYIADQSNGFIILDVSNPSSPVEVHSTDGFFYSVVVSENIAYAFSEVDPGLFTASLMLFDVSDPNNTNLLGEVSLGEGTGNIQVVGSVAYVTSISGISLLDISDSINPTFLSHFDLPNWGFPEKMQIVDGVAYVINGQNSNLVMLDVSTPVSPTLLSTFGTAHSPRSVHIEDDTAYVSSNIYNGEFYGGDLVSIDISDPYQPTLLNLDVSDADRPSSIGGNSTQVTNNIAYIAAGTNKLRIIDVSNPDEPVELPTFDAVASAYDLEVVGSTAYVAGGADGLVLLDASNPVSPTIRSSFNITGHINGVEIQNNIAYLNDSANDSVHIIDVSNLDEPIKLSTFDAVADAYGLEVIGDTLYLAGGSDGLLLLDVSNPVSPTIRSSFDTTGRVNGVEVKDNIVYINDNSEGLLILNINNPDDLVRMDSVNGNGMGSILNTQIIDGIVYASGGDNGLYLLRYIPPPGDRFETDNLCADGLTVETNGQAQTRSFHDLGDVDWVQFDVEENQLYSVIADVPLGSRADVVVEIYDVCNGAIEVEQEHSFAPGIRLDFVAPSSGTYYLKLYNNEAAVFGDDVTYSLTVREIATEEPPQSAVILVAGRLYENDTLQDNIYHVTNSVYQMYRESEYPDGRIQYLANDLTLDPIEGGASEVDGLATLENLQTAITSWAINRVDENRALTLYMMSHGYDDQFFLDGEDEAVTSTQLDAWLTTLEDTVRTNGGGDVKINVIIDACHSGSFIDGAETISKPGRVVITSAEPDELARATRKGALFSDNFTRAVRNDYTLFDAFNYASGATKNHIIPHTPWIDDNGNGIPNEPEDGLLAAVRGFGFRGTFGVGDPYDWEPYIAETYAVTQGIDTQVAISARVLDDSEDTATTDDDVSDVWAVLYPPSYEPPPADSVELVAEDQPIVSMAAANGIYAGNFCPDEIGEWAAVIYAEDGDGLVSRPNSITFDITEMCSSNTPMAVTMSQQTAKTLPLTVISLGVMVLGAAVLLKSQAALQDK